EPGEGAGVAGRQGPRCAPLADRATQTRKGGSQAKRGKPASVQAPAGASRRAGKREKTGRHEVAGLAQGEVECGGREVAPADGNSIAKAGLGFDQDKRFSPTEVYPPCGSPDDPASSWASTADRPLFVSALKAFIRRGP